MAIHLVHFTNRHFGQVFMAAHGSLALESRMPYTLTLVLSEPKTKGVLSQILRCIKHPYKKYIIKKQLGFRQVNIIFVESVNDPSFLKKLPTNAHAICTGFNQIFEVDLIAQFTSFVNIHPSVLPYYRGPVPSRWCLANQEKKTGFTLHQITEKIDNGDIIHQDILPIYASDTESTLDQRIALLAVPVFKTYILSLIQETKMPIQQLESGTIYATKTGYKSFH